MTTPANVDLVELDAWELRCIFNESLLLANVASGRLTMVPRNPKKPPGSRLWSYRDRNNDEVATAHFYERNGSVVSPPDPKSVKVGNIRYVLYDDDLSANPEKRYFNSKEWRKRYGCYRKVKCCVFGPLNVLSVVSLNDDAGVPLGQTTPSSAQP